MLGEGEEKKKVSKSKLSLRSLFLTPVKQRGLTLTDRVLSLSKACELKPLTSQNRIVMLYPSITSAKHTMLSTNLPSHSKRDIIIFHGTFFSFFFSFSFHFSFLLRHFFYCTKKVDNQISNVSGSSSEDITQNEEHNNYNTDNNQH